MLGEAETTIVDGCYCRAVSIAVMAEVDGDEESPVSGAPEDAIE